MQPKMSCRLHQRKYKNDIGDRGKSEKAEEMVIAAERDTAKALQTERSFQFSKAETSIRMYEKACLRE